MRKTLSLLSWLTVVALGCSVAAASYEIPWYAMTSGGGVSQGGPYRLDGAAGQSAVGRLTGGTYVLGGGFLVEGAVCRAPAGTPPLTLDKLGTDLVELGWGALPSAAAYDVLSGDLAALRNSNGDYTASVVTCEADDLNDTSLVLAAAGDSWFLVRGVSCASGMYDSGGPGQIGSRDPEIEISGTSCP